MKKYLLLFVLAGSISSAALSQSNLSASVGMGLPELANAGIRYQLSQVKFGMSIGTAFTGIYSFSGDVYYHFTGNSNLSKTAPWYVRANVTYWPFGKILFIDLGEAVLFGFRVGRELNVTENIGINIDAGIIPFSFFSGKKLPVSFIPSLGFSLFYRFESLYINRFNEKSN